MKRFFIFLFLSLAISSSIVSACGVDDGHNNGAIIGFGFFGGIVSALIIVALILGIMVLSKNMKGGRS